MVGKFLFFITIFLIFLNPYSMYSMNNINDKITIFTYHKKQSKDDKRFGYDNELLKLSLEKTIKKYGPYKLIPINVNANYRRVEALAINEKYENLFFKQSVSTERLNNLGYVSFPVDLGIVGYRVGFVSKNNINKIEKIKDLKDFKKVSIIQGLGWLDTKILKYNGFTIVTGNNYAGLFKMVAKNRGDLFLRGANELYEEWNANMNIGNLSYDKTIALYYPLPRFFFTNKKNKDAIKRVKEGLVLAYNDGSLMKLWEKHYLKSIKFANLPNRRIFKLTNPFLEEIDKSYEKYIYTP